jgi:hypothetical protein
MMVSFALASLLTRRSPKRAHEEKEKNRNAPSKVCRFDEKLDGPLVDDDVAVVAHALDTPRLALVDNLRGEVVRVAVLADWGEGRKRRSISTRREDSER